MAIVESLQELRSEVMNEFQKVSMLQEDHRPKIQNVMGAHMTADQAGQEHQRWKVDNESRIFRHDNQPATLGSTVSDLVARLEKLEKSSVLPDGARGKDWWQITRPKDTDPAEFVGKKRRVA